MSMFGYGDGGSGCTEEMIELMHRFDKLSVMPKCTHTGGAEFLEKNLKDNENLEVWDGELYLEKASIFVEDQRAGVFLPVVGGSRGALALEDRRLAHKLFYALIAASEIATLLGGLHIRRAECRRRWSRGKLGRRRFGGGFDRGCFTSGMRPQHSIADGSGGGLGRGGFGIGRQRRSFGLFLRGAIGGRGAIYRGRIRRGFRGGGRGGGGLGECILFHRGLELKQG